MQVYRASLVVLALLLCTTAHAEPAALGTLTLSQAEALLLAHNHGIQSAERMVEGLRADRISAAQRPNPTLSLGVTSISVERKPAGKYWDKPLDSVMRLEQSIERGDKRELRIRTAEQAIKSGEADTSEIIRQQRIALASAYYDLLLAQDKERINRQTVALYEKSVGAAHLRLKAGDVAPTELARLQVEAARASNDLRQSQAEQEKAQIALAYLIGAEKQAAQIHASDLWPEVQALAGLDLESLLDTRPDIRSAQARVAFADARRAQARALLKRDVSVGMQYEHYPPDARNTVGIGISFPLQLNYQYEGEIRRAESDYSAALEDLEQVRAAARSELGRIRSDLESTAELVARYRNELLAKAEKSAAAAEFAYQRGALPLLDLFDARRTLRSIQLETAGACSNYAKALSAWQISMTREKL
ncbi:MAG: TolC family protein [Sulfurimicrobium sp.]|nr:TolC family protein [Sulfurimicrobium sp.]MDP1704601.1 TolC family protein [Sulfurimicrobium sp.]MDP2199075.1 TolC family protein [Sulfurimicrobium sp.]